MFLKAPGQEYQQSGISNPEKSTEWWILVAAGRMYTYYVRKQNFAYRARY